MKKSHKETYFGDFVRINPLWLSAEGEYLRDQLGYTDADPVAWSVETGEVSPVSGLVLWTVAGDFADPATAARVAIGEPFATAAYGPGDKLAVLCCAVVDDRPCRRAFAEFVEWGGDYAPETFAEEVAALSLQLGQTVHPTVEV